jgi:hypothetical protein
LVGLVNLKDDRAWLFQHQEFVTKAQQHNEQSHHLYFYIDPKYQPHHDGCHERDFESFRIERRMVDLFGVPLFTN